MFDLRVLEGVPLSIIFKKMTLARMFSGNCLLNSLTEHICIQVGMLQHAILRKELPQISFYLFCKQLILKTRFQWLHFHEVILIKQCYHPLVQKSGINISN